MTAIAPTELLPCPFCGGPASHRQRPLNNGYPDLHEIWCENTGCEVGVETVDGDFEVAAKIWNTRQAASVERAGIVPDREAFWLIERVGHSQYVKDRSELPGLTNDPWRAARFVTEREAHDFWLRLVSLRDECKPVEHMFVNKPDKAVERAEVAGEAVIGGVDVRGLADCFEADEMRGRSPIRGFTAPERRIIATALRALASPPRSEGVRGSEVQTESPGHWQARPPHSDWRMIAPEHVDDYRAKDWEVRRSTDPAQEAVDPQFAADMFSDERLIAESPPALRQLAFKLTALLDADHWNNIEPLLLNVARLLPSAECKYCDSCGAKAMRLEACDAEIGRMHSFMQELSNALIKVRPLGGSELFVQRFGGYYADPAYCGHLIAEMRERLQAEIMVRIRAEKASPAPSAHRCARCGCETKGEVALLGDQEWCHPCADSIELPSEKQMITDEGYVENAEAVAGAILALGVAQATWMPIETAPKDGEPVDLFSTSGRRWCNYRWDKDFPYEAWSDANFPNRNWRDRPFMYASQVTHWMPIPKGPDGPWRIRAPHERLRRLYKFRWRARDYV